MDAVQSPLHSPYAPCPGDIRPDIGPAVLIITPPVHQPGFEQPVFCHRPGKQAGGLDLFPACIGRRLGKERCVHGQRGIEDPAVRAERHAGCHPVFSVFLARIGARNRPDLNRPFPVFAQREQASGEAGGRFPAPSRFAEEVRAAETVLPVQGHTRRRDCEAKLAFPSQPARMRPHGAVQRGKKRPLAMTAGIVPRQAAVGSRSVERPGGHDSVRPFRKSVQRRKTRQLESAPESQSLPVADIVVTDENLPFRQPVKAIESPTLPLPGPGRLQVPGREAVFRAHILERCPEKGGMTECNRVPDRFAGTAGGFQGKERAERSNSLFPESVHPFQFGEGQDVTGEAAVFGKRRNLVRSQQSAVQQAGPGGPVDG